VAERLAILAEGLFDDYHAKTAHGAIRYGQREVVAVVDSHLAGRSAEEVVPFCALPVPIVASVRDAAQRGADTLLIGIAPTGGKLTGEYRAILLEAIDAGLNLEAGLHTILRDDRALREAADSRGVELRDLRLSPADLDVPEGPQGRRPGLRVVHSVGSDCAIGKKVVTLELDRAARGRGLRSVYVPTGQTGIAIAGWGIAVDHVISDYVAGAAERLVNEGGQRGDLLFLEGQGSLYHPAYSGVTLGLLHGSAPDAMVLAHMAGAEAINGFPDVRLPPLSEQIATYERMASIVSPARVAAVALNTAALDDAAARKAVAEAEGEAGVVADDVVRFGSERTLDAVLGALGGVQEPAAERAP
jgi:uncharacterized NAD-dependent epimerase/dehydratase family protein